MRPKADSSSTSARAAASTAESDAVGWMLDPLASRYALEFVAALPTPPRRRRGRGVALGAERLHWNDGADAARTYAQVFRISVTFFDKADNGGGSCRVDLTDGSSLTVSSGVHAGAASAERDAAYDAFLHDLHARLSQADRLRITFRDGIPIPNSGIAIIAGAIGAVGLIPAVIAALRGDPGVTAALTFGIVGTTVTALVALLAQGRTEGRRYDPAYLPKHALSGQKHVLP